MQNRALEILRENRIQLNKYRKFASRLRIFVLGDFRHPRLVRVHLMLTNLLEVCTSGISNCLRKQLWDFSIFDEITFKTHHVGLLKNL